MSETENPADVESTPAHTTWPGMSDPSHSQWYTERFREMAARGEDLQGEARLVDALAARGARLLDAGCGPGRHAGYLTGLGHEVVGVDIDPLLIAAAGSDYPEGRWVVADLATLDLTTAGESTPFDGAFIAGNVMDFVTPADRRTVIKRVAAHLRDDGFLAVGCRTDHGFTPSDLDAVLPDADLTLEHRFATWDLRLWHPDAPFCVSIVRRVTR
jgi:SAM-dependent methyltransferase